MVFRSKLVRNYSVQYYDEVWPKTTVNSIKMKIGPRIRLYAIGLKVGLNGAFERETPSRVLTAIAVNK